ncbi:unnamed protein product [Closterium sp. NIES-53]
MVDCLPALCRGVAPALQKGDLPTQQVDGVPTPQQNGCPALPRGRQQCACSQVRADDWPDLHRCASVGCFLRLTSHIDFGIPARSRLHHHDLNDVRVPPQKSPSRLPGRPGQPQVLWSTTKCLCEGGANTPLPLTEEVVVVAVELGAVVVAEAAVVPQEEGALEKVQDKQARLLAVFRPAGWCLTGPGSPCVCGRDDHSAARCFRRLDDLYRARWGTEATTLHWACLLARKIPVFDLYMDDARQYALYADVDYSADGFVCSRVGRLACLPPASVDLCLSTPGSPQAVASLSFTLDSGASQCFFRDHTTLTPLLAPVPVALADPSSGPAVACSSTTLPCPVVLSGVLRGLHIPSITWNLVGVGYLHDRGITITFVGGGRTAVCTNTVTGRVLATFTREPRSGLYVLHTEHSSVSTSPQVDASCSCRSFTHRTVLWHHRLGHPSIPHLCTMASHRLVSGLPRVFPLLPPSPAPPCTPCVAGRLRATPHSSSLRPATAPFQTLHLDVWGPAPTQGPERERYFLVVVDDFSRYTTVFPLVKKSETGSPGVGSAFRVWGCLALVRDTSADKLSARAVPCVFLGFSVASADWSFYHPPLHQFLDSRDDESVSYYTRYPCRGLPVPPPPLFLAPSLPSAPAPSVPPPPPGPAPSTGGAGTRGASSGGAGAGGAGMGGANSGGVGVGGLGTRGARTGGAEAGDPDPVGTPSGDTGSRGASSEVTGAGGTTSAESTLPPHRHETRYQAAFRRAREEQERLEQERQKLRQLDLLEYGLRALGLPSSPPVRPTSPSAFGPTFSPPDAYPAVWSSPPSQSPPPVVRHYRSRPCPSSARPSSPVTDLHTALLCTSLRRRPPPVSVLPSPPPPSSLPVSPTPISNYYCAVRPIISRVLATGVTDPRFSPSSVSALTAAVADFTVASRLDYSTRVVPASPTRPLSVGGEFALGCDVLEDRH